MPISPVNSVRGQEVAKPQAPKAETAGSVAMSKPLFSIAANNKAETAGSVANAGGSCGGSCGGGGGLNVMA